MGGVIGPLMLARIAGMSVYLIAIDLSALSGDSSLLWVVSTVAVGVVAVVVWSIALSAHVALYRSISG